MITNCAPAVAIRPAATRSGWLYDAGLVAIGSLLIAVSAQIALYLPIAISPVPITAQTLAVLLVGALFGSRRGAATVLAYLAEGAAGLPVFAGGAGAAHLVGPTAGYLLGFVACAFVVGWLFERGWGVRPSRTVAALSIGTAVILVPGALWLAVFVGPPRAVTAGLLPFIPGAVFKITLATTLLAASWRQREQPETS